MSVTPGKTEPRHLSPRAATMMGALFVGVGLLVVLAAGGVIPADDKSFHAPRWVVSACGLLFVVAGVAVAVTAAPGAPEGAGRTTWRSLLLGGTIVGLMAAVFNWIAFGPGERRFGGGIALPFVSIGGPASEWSGRATFGLAAVLLDLFLVWFLARGLRELLGRRR
jgi:hypothetical protein